MPTDAKDRAAAKEEPKTPSAQASEVVCDRALDDLAGGVWDALRIRPPAWGASFFGSPVSWLPARYSEFGLLYSWRVLRTARYVADVSIPSMPVTAPAWFPEPLAPFFWHPSRVGQHPDHNESSTAHPHEAWLFINGIMTNDALARQNAAYLADLFHRPITLIENSTDGVLEDLVECVREKSFGRNAEATEKAFPAIYEALKDPEKRRVVVIAHSQGTIIASAVLRLMALIYESGQRRSAVARDPQAARAAVLDDGVRLDPTDFEPLDRDELGSSSCTASRTARRRCGTSTQQPAVASPGSRATATSSTSSPVSACSLPGRASAAWPSTDPVTSTRARGVISSTGTTCAQSITASGRGTSMARRTRAPRPTS